MDLSWRPNNDQSVATELTLHSIAFLRSSCGRLSGLSRRFHCVHCAFTPSYKRSRDTVTQWHLRERHTISMVTPPITTAFAQRPLCVSAELLWRCRRPYCAAMVTLRSYQNAERRRLFCACTKCAPTLDVLCDLNASTGEATVLHRRCLWSYCTHLSVLNFSWTPWDRRENAALVWQGF